MYYVSVHCNVKSVDINQKWHKIFLIFDVMRDTRLNSKSYMLHFHKKTINSRVLRILKIFTEEQQNHTNLITLFPSQKNFNDNNQKDSWGFTFSRSLSYISAKELVNEFLKLRNAAENATFFFIPRSLTFFDFYGLMCSK